MKKIAFILPMLLLLLSCATEQKTAYLKDAPRDEQMPLGETYGTRIFPGDQLYIYVYSQTPESVTPFNEETNHTDYNSYTADRSKVKAFKPKGHIVSANGELLFPLIGTVQVAGMTIDQLSKELEKRLKEGHYVTDPIVSISLMNFRVTVIGEVAQPQQLHADGNRMTIFEAIAQCGDITMDGRPEKVVVVRTTDNIETIDTVDLTSRRVLGSPYYFLQQNDIIYVTPTKKKQRTAYRNEEWPIYLSTGIEAVRFAYTTIYRWFFDPKTKEYFK